MGMRWEATSATGGPFAALDANITLSAEGIKLTRLTLTGVYRPPLEMLSAVPERVFLNKAATTTIKSLLARICEALESGSQGHS